MRSKLDSTNRQKDSKADRKPSLKVDATRQDAREFVEAILAYPLTLQFSLWNLQGVLRWGYPARHGKVPAALDFAREIELAMELGWLKELAEDTELTKEESDQFPGVRCENLCKNGSRHGDQGAGWAICLAVSGCPEQGGRRDLVAIGHIQYC